MTSKSIKIVLTWPLVKCWDVYFSTVKTFYWQFSSHLWVGTISSPTLSRHFKTCLSFLCTLSFLTFVSKSCSEVSVQIFLFLPAEFAIDISAPNNFCCELIFYEVMFIPKTELGSRWDFTDIFSGSMEAFVMILLDTGIVFVFFSRIDGSREI